LKLKSLDFRREREASWTELDDLVGLAEKRGLDSLTGAQLVRLPTLYRAALSSLGVARTISLDLALLTYLESLCGRAYLTIYGGRRRVSRHLVDFVARRFPATVRAFRRHVAVSALFMLLGTAVAWVSVARDPDRFYTFVGASYAQGRSPAASTESLRDTLYHGDEDAIDSLSSFATYLFTHNAGIGMLSFALGIVGGIPVFLLMFTNGLVVGAFAALFGGRGLGAEYWAWVLPHGVTELTACVLCGAAGLVLAGALVFPGRHTRLDNLAARGRDAATIVVGAVAMLLVAGLIEGIFRQRVHDIAIRLAVAAGTAIAWLGYFVLAGRRPS
jgi:uncharacterized membrane protein SpoIIM required for sporulation